LESAVERILAEALQPDELVHGVRRFVWRRRLALRLNRLQALVLDSTASDALIEAELDALVELGTALPRPIIPDAR
jgi:hypothetical protein